MIRRLQRKFILIAMSVLLLIIALLIVSINGFYFYHMDNIADGIMELLAENAGNFPEPDQYEPPGRNPSYQYKMTAETRFETRYFTIRTTADGADMEINTVYIAAVSAGQARQYAIGVLSGRKTSGYEGIYKYLVIEESDGLLIIFLDRHLQIQAMLSFFWVSCCIGIVSLAIMFVLVSVLSKRAIKPVIDSIEKQKQFITDAGHEIKTPLAIISANTEVLELSYGKSEWTQSIHKQTARLDGLVKQLLTLSRMDERKVQLVFFDFSLSELVCESAASFGILAEKQGKRFETHIQSGIFFHGDESSIREVISILLDNAVKYSCDQGEINVSLCRQGKSVFLEVRNVSDTLPEGNLDQLFDRFFRADASRSQETGGYGIGLSVAKAIVQAHRGKISARREDDSKICFSVVL